MRQHRHQMAALLVVGTIVMAACTSTSGQAISASDQRPGRSAVSGSSGPVSASGGSAAGRPSSPASGTTASPAATNSGAATDPAVPDTPEPVRNVWTLDGALPLGQPVMSGSVAVVYLAGPGDVAYLAGIWPSTGKVLWRKPTVLDELTPEPVVLGDTAVYARSADFPNDMQLVAIKTRDGAEISSSKDTYWAARNLEVCDGGACFSADVGDTVKRFTFQPGTGAVVPFNGGDDAWAVNENLVIEANAAGADGDRMTNRVGGKITWTMPVVNVFGQNAKSVDSIYSGWRRIDDKMHHYVVTVTPALKDGTYRPSEIWRTVGIAAADGKILWTEPGTQLGCVQGAAQPDLSISLRCRYSADAMVRVTNGAVRLTKGSVSLESFNVDTGKAYWNLPLSTINVGLTGLDELVLTDLAGRWVITSVDGRMVADPMSEDPPTKYTGDVPMLCSRSVQGQVFGWSGTLTGAPLVLGNVVDACTLDGDPIAPDRRWPAAAVADIDDIQLVATSAGLQAWTTRTDLPQVAAKWAGVSQASLQTSVNTKAASNAAPAELWTAQGFETLSQPQVSGNTVLVYGERDGQNTLEAVAAQTGKPLWHKNIAGHVDQSTAPAVAGDAVLYLEQDGDATNAVLLDIPSGKVRHRTSWLNSPSQPWNCQGDLCLYIDYGDSSTMLRFDVAAGFPRFERFESNSSDGGYSSGLYSATTGAAMTLYTVGDHQVSMQTDATALIPDGFTFVSRPVYFADENVHLLPLGKVLPQGEESTHPATDNLMVAIDAKTGAKLWETQGGNTDCLPTAQRLWPRSVAVRCRWAADTTVDASGLASKAPVIEGFDVRTGKSLWSVDLRKFRMPASSAWVGEDQIVVVTEAGERAVDLRTGKIAPAGRRICNQALIRNNYWQGVMLDWCDGSKPVALPGPWPTWVGAQSGDVRVVFTQGGLKGYRQPPAKG